MQNTVAHALAEAPLPDQLLAIKLLEHMRFDRLATDDPTAYTAILRQRLLNAGLPVHQVDGTSPGDSPGARLTIAERTLAEWKAQAAVAIDRYYAARAEVEAYEYALYAFDGALAGAVWAGHANWTATTTLNERRYRYDSQRDEIFLLGACSTNQRRDHLALITSREQLHELWQDQSAMGWTCELGLCPDLTSSPVPAA